MVKYYSDADCQSELATPGSRFTVPPSGETSCNAQATFQHISLSVDPSDVLCDPANPASCSVKGGAAVGYKVGCNADCSQCESVQPSDGTYKVEECTPISTDVSKTETGSYLKVSTSTYTGALYLGASEKNPGSSIKMYDPVTLASIYFDQSGKATNRYATSLATLDDDSDTLYAALLNDILWQCSSTQSNSCGTWNTTPTLPHMIIAANGYIYVAINNGDIWQCPTNSANSCVTYASLSQSVISLAYDQGSNTLYAGTGCSECETAYIYQLANLGSGGSPEVIYAVNGWESECDISVQDMVVGGGQLWATSSGKCWTSTVTPDGGVVTSYSYGGQVITCSSGSCKEVAAGAPYWGVTYDPDHNLIFVSQVGHSVTNQAAGSIQKVSASSFDMPTAFANLGSMQEGLDPSSMSSTLPPQALLYADGYLWIGTGNTDCASCNSLFRCPVTADNVNPSCSQVKLNCDSAHGCMGAQSMAYIADVNYP